MPWHRASPGDGASSESSTGVPDARDLRIRRLRWNSGHDGVTAPLGVTVRFVQYYLDCLSQASYLIGDETTGRAAVVDPRRDIQDYLDDAAAGGLSIDYVIETHVHADFLSGHLELAAATGATIVYGEAADVHFPHRKVADGERIQLGQVGLEFRATPGHTPESVCIVVWESPGADAPYGVLTGDTLFIGDVGRPDLQGAQGLSAEVMARQLYRSLHASLLTLPDATRVYPAHGAGPRAARTYPPRRRRPSASSAAATTRCGSAPPRTSWPRSPRDSRPSPATSPGWPNSTGNPTGSRTSRSRRC